MNNESVTKNGTILTTHSIGGFEYIKVKEPVKLTEHKQGGFIYYKIA
jgi:hypothetical protein